MSIIYAIRRWRHGESPYGEVISIDQYPLSDLPSLPDPITLATTRTGRVLCGHVAESGSGRGPLRSPVRHWQLSTVSAEHDGRKLREISATVSSCRRTLLPGIVGPGRS